MVNSKYIINAQISEDSWISIDSQLCNHFHIGNWFSGEWIWGGWHDGNWHNGNWKDGFWTNGIWINGIWVIGSICKGGIYQYSKISPKSYFKPKTTISLNYAQYI